MLSLETHRKSFLGVEAWGLWRENSLSALSVGMLITSTKRLVRHSVASSFNGKG